MGSRPRPLRWQGKALVDVGVRVTTPLGAWWEKNITRFERCDYRNETQWFAAGAGDAVYLAPFCHDDIAGCDLNGAALFVDLVIALTAENRPCILAFRMCMGSYRLPRLNVPSDDD